MNINNLKTNHLNIAEISEKILSILIKIKLFITVALNVPVFVSVINVSYCFTSRPAHIPYEYMNCSWCSSVP
jgi:hypothetical protein